MARKPRDNRFGGDWTRIKLDTLEGYLGFYTEALKYIGFKLHYIDAFAGNGMCEFQHEGRTERMLGSARRALNVVPAFDRLDFIDTNPANVQQLQTLCDEHPNRNIQIHQADANAKLRDLCATTNWRDTRAVLFVDPYGMALHYDTLKVVADTHAIDVWYLFPLASLFRQAARRLDRVSNDKADAITRLLGDDSWRDILYAPAPMNDLFDGERMERDADVDAIEEFALHRLAQVFPKVAQPRRLFMDNIPMFSLIFAVSNPSHKAIGLSMRAANHLLQRDA